MNFEEEQPEEGFFFSTSIDIEKVKQLYQEYDFELLEETSHPFNDSRAIVQLYAFTLQNR